MRKLILGKRLYFIALVVFYTLVFMGCAQGQTYKQGPVPVIFDTDIGPDYDDAGAIHILHVLADNGEARILATIASNKYDRIAGVINVFNTYFGRENIPIGVPKGEANSLKDVQHWTDSLLVDFPHLIKSNDEVPDAVKLYRKILAEQPDTSVTIITVGFLTNLSNLLNSEKDEFSPLSGRDLVVKKVKRVVSMGGNFPSGKEFNIYKDAMAAQNVTRNWPTPIIFSGFEIGKKIKTGLPLINNKNIRNSPVKKAFSISIPQKAIDSSGRMSWDQQTTIVGIRGYALFYDLKEGNNEIDSIGQNTWDLSGKGHYYLVEKESPEKMTNLIDSLMMELPKE